MDYLQYLEEQIIPMIEDEVLNLVINGLPSIQDLQTIYIIPKVGLVLNLVINGLPSIRKNKVF